jgi:spore maturation protein SpmA
MALSRIWTAFILIGILIAGTIFFTNPSRDDIFERMVTGTAKDEYKFVSLLDSTKTAKLSAEMKEYGYIAQTKADNDTRFIVSETATNDSAKKIQSKFLTAKIVDQKYLDGRKQRRVDGIFATCKSAVEICISLIGIMALFLGFMSIAEKAGGINFMARLIGPFFNKIFPEIPKNHPAHGHMVMNFSANLLGLDNAATPFGIKAMESLQEINPNKETISNPQIMFLTLHASGLTLIPITIIADRVAKGSKYPTDIFIPCMIATFMATLAALSIVAYRQKINLFQAAILKWIAGVSVVIAALVWFIHSLSPEMVRSFSGSLGNGILLFVFFGIVAGGLYKKINIFEAFIEGAKAGFDTAIRIVPYLVGLLVAISVFRNSGAFDVILGLFKQLFMAIGLDSRIVDALPTSLIKPMSGSGARAMHIDTMTSFGPDSWTSNLASVFRGSADTTFYIAAVYLGAVGIKNGRYAIGTMLLADLVGIITSIILAYLFFV